MCSLYDILCVYFSDFFFTDLMGDSAAFWGMVSCLFKNNPLLLG